ncbi:MULTISPECIES: class I SAM-dependent methyltransferase [Kordiimonas]|jgi:SAM-dependent methyltransferase|uniref:class I SAM-dependent methyltransferase n=1 Tax=Kordiimonas TaxID=288021 RepID=UPI00257A640E|nr:class I SAM-dependent methyltransferase [Kordiimonas sp. UBA4487]
MRPDVLALYRFYESALGRASCPIISAKLARLTAPKADSITIGFGFTLPYLDYLAQAEQDAGSRYLGFMPAQQGVCHWPAHVGSRTALVEEYNLPLADSSVDRMILVHALEHANRPVNLLREIWRVLAPGGQLIAVVPNRMRSWAAYEGTPFGHGRPYSKGQLATFLEEQMLPVDGWDTALMMPPFMRPIASRMLKYGERPIGVLGRNLGGALIVSARKQVYGTIPKSAKKVGVMPVLTGP